MTLPSAASIGVVASRRVPAANIPAFESGLKELLQTAASQPGHLICEVVRGPPGPGSQDYHLIYRFEDEASLRAWDNSPARQALIERLAPLAEDSGRRELTGMEAWFELPPGQPPPPRYKMALLTFAGIWPLVSLALWFVAPHLHALPFLARTAINSALLVLVMTYIVMPRLARIAGPWLQKPRQQK